MMRALLLCIIMCIVVWTAGFVLFAAKIPSTLRDISTKTDAIVVLTGGSERVEEGMRLLKDGMAKTLFISGVGEGVFVHELFPEEARDEALSHKIILGYDAKDTYGNAIETAQWARRQKIKSVRVVTGNYHMARSLRELKNQLPEVKIVPHPVMPEQVKHQAWWKFPGSAKLIFTEYNKFLLVYVRGIVG
jgi:uncharacterized SAM-binding protein YcdF (DUF218 family)